MNILEKIKTNIERKQTKRILEKIDSVHDDETKRIIIDREIKNPYGKLEALKKIENEDVKIGIIRTLPEDYMIKAIDLVTHNSKAKILLNIKGRDNIRLALNKIPLEIVQENRKKGLLANFAKENLESFIEYETGIIGEENKRIQDRIAKLQEKNDEVFNTVQFDILNDRYISTLGIDTIELLVPYQYEQRRVLNLDEKQYNVFVKCINNSIDTDNKRVDPILVDNLLQNIQEESFQEVIDSLNSDENIDYDQVTKCLMSGRNYFNINNTQDLEQIDEIRRNVCDLIIEKGFAIEEEYPNIFPQSSGIMKFAILQKLYGQDTNSAEKIVHRYGQDIDNIEITEDNIDEIYYVKSLKAILEENNADVLKKLYNTDITLDKESINPLVMERRLKSAYSNEYNKTLLKVEDCERIEIEDCEGYDIFNAGTDFSMIITSIAPYAGEVKGNELKHDWADDWNRNSTKSQAFSASYIRNDMIATAEVRHFCYGFDSISEDSLLLSSPGDLASQSSTLVPYTPYESYINFCTPDSQINNTPDYRLGYNEMLLNRVQDGERKQPSYIVVYKENGLIENLEVAKEASKDFEPQLPIVVIDKDECAKSERNKLGNMIEEYKATENMELLQQIRQKVKNNQFWNNEFIKKGSELEINLQELDTLQTVQKSKEEGIIKEEEYEECYKNVNVQDRQKSVSIIRSIYNEIENIKEQGVELVDE